MIKYAQYAFKVTKKMKISRTGIENFTRCKRCFWLDAVKKIAGPIWATFYFEPCS